MELRRDPNILPLHDLHDFSDLPLSVTVAVRFSRIEITNSLVVRNPHYITGGRPVAYGNVRHQESSPSQNSVLLNFAFMFLLARGGRKSD